MINQGFFPENWKLKQFKPNYFSKPNLICIFEVFMLYSLTWYISYSWHLPYTKYTRHTLKALLHYLKKVYLLFSVFFMDLYVFV